MGHFKKQKVYQNLMCVLRGKNGYSDRVQPLPENSAPTDKSPSGFTLNEMCAL